MAASLQKVWWSSLLVLYWISATGSSSTEEISKIQRPITSAVHRRIRGLSYPDDSEMGIFFALAIPLDDPVSAKAISVAFFFEANYQLTKPETEGADNEAESRRERSMNLQGRAIDRRTTYSMLESKFESLGFPGRACLLRSICETSRNPLHYHNGLLGDLLRILFIPSSSSDEGLSVEFQNAQNHSSTTGGCEATYPLCPINIYDYITAEENI
ncbi:uncharacterized protein [Venturia canescens]|uniref:uncharacterized protein n=1 Tax=Venturia canescens TaxID=32260 RepID=UPI001C9C439E|nr:uncharacterized protein LOC122418456 [Venturia canescens]